MVGRVLWSGQSVLAWRGVTGASHGGGKGNVEARLVMAWYGWASGGTAARALTVAAAKWLVFLVPAALLLAWFWPSDGLPARRHLLIASGVSLALSGLVALPLTTLIVRARPFVALGLTPLFAHGTDSSFPSDHTLVGAALAAPLVWRLWRMGAPLLVVALLAGCARVAAGVHWPSDIAASAVLALALGALALPLTRVALEHTPRSLRRLARLDQALDAPPAAPR